MSRNKLFYLWNVGAQQVIEVPEHSIFGRSDETYYPIESEVASRSHFKLYFKNNHPVIEDLHSSNGTFINGLGLEPGEVFEIGNYDIITVGECHYVFFFAESLKEFSKENLMRKFGDDFPKDFQAEILKKLIAFERYALPKFSRIMEARKFQFAIADVEDARSGELGVIEEKERLVDEQKANLEKLYREKMEIIENNYLKINAQKNSINNKYDSMVEEIKQDDSLYFDLSQKDLFSKYFFSSIESENETYTDTIEETVIFKPKDTSEKVVKGLSFGSQNKEELSEED